MSIVRISSDHKLRRVIGFKAWHKGLKRMTLVRSCHFDSVDEVAELLLPEEKVSFKAQMKELILLQNTNSITTEGREVYEGDIVLVEVENIFGSFEHAVAEVIFDDEQWGYSLRFVSSSGLQLTGCLQVVDVLGNAFEGIETDKQTIYDEQVNHSGSKA